MGFMTGAPLIPSEVVVVVQNGPVAVLKFQGGGTGYSEPEGIAIESACISTGPAVREQYDSTAISLPFIY